MSNAFSRHVLTWFDQHGRKHLPWQQNTTPYRVWISEIMLQQTQVNTVIPYFEKFMQRFPDIQTLASAPEDAVLHHWTGLGYYARARNLHKTAKQICENFENNFPDSLDALQTLPGIGRSTAGAILALAFKQKATILDGNVKRVLARYHAIDGWPGNTTVSNQLWEIAEKLTPKKRCDDYTQAMMDLGATLCTRTKPQCTRCPLQKNCLAHRAGEETLYPGKKPKKTLPIKKIFLLLLENDNTQLFLEKRPPAGIWGGLWSLPEFPNFNRVKQDCLTRYNYHIVKLKKQPAFRHTFSHFHLDITPVQAKVASQGKAVMATQETLWHHPGSDTPLGLAAPVKRLLDELVG